MCVGSFVFFSTLCFVYTLFSLQFEFRRSSTVTHRKLWTNFLGLLNNCRYLKPTLMQKDWNFPTQTLKSGNMQTFLLKTIKNFLLTTVQQSSETIAQKCAIDIQVQVYFFSFPLWLPRFSFVWFVQFLLKFFIFTLFRQPKSWYLAQKYI